MKDVSLKAQTRDNKRGRSAVETVFIIDCLFLQSPVLNSVILEVPNSRSTPHVMWIPNLKKKGGGGGGGGGLGLGK